MQSLLNVVSISIVVYLVGVFIVYLKLLYHWLNVLQFESAFKGDLRKLSKIFAFKYHWKWVFFNLNNLEFSYNPSKCRTCISYEEKE